MADTVFRTAQESQTTEEQLPSGAKQDNQSVVNDVEVPYTDYATQHNHPHAVDYFQLGDTWQDPEGGFAKEVGTIESYIANKITAGELANNTKDVVDHLKRLEKLTNVDKDSRAIVKIETLAAYVEFLMKTDDLKAKLHKYGNT